MHNEESVEKIDMIDDTNVTVVPQLPSKQVKICRTRRSLLILLGILFTFDLIYLIISIYAYVDNLWISRYFKNNNELIWTIISIIYYTFGLFVTYRYKDRGLRLFAWIGTICFILLCTVTGFILIAASNTRKQAAIADVDIIGPLIFILMFVLSSILLLIVILLAFKLSKLIIRNQNTTIQSI